MHYTKQVLKNGLTIVKVPSKDAESVVVDIFVKTGSRSENEKEAGMSHFLEHFLFKGTSKFPTSVMISSLVDGIGGDMNASTGQESTQFYIKARKEFLSLIFEILSDMIHAPLFDPEELAREKGVIIEEMNMYNDQPQSVVAENLDQLMWPGQPLGRPIIGNKKTIESFTPQDFRDYMKKHYQPSNMIIGVSGNFKDKELDKLVANLWGHLPKKKGGGFVKADSRQVKPRLKVTYKETEQAHWVMGFRSFHDNDPRNRALSLLGTILGGGMSSRLFVEIREKRGLAYYVKAGNASLQDTGQFLISAGVQTTQVEESLRVTLSELRRMTESLVDEQELSKAKEYLKGRSALALEDNQVRLDWFLEQVAFRKVVRTPEEAFALFDKVTPKMIRQVAQEVFQPKQISLSVIGPYKDEARFKEVLENE